MLQTPLPGFAPNTDWKAPELRDLPSWRDAKVVGLDLETCDPQLHKLGPGVRRGGYIAGVSFHIEGHKSYYLPIAHEGGGNMDPARVLDYLKDQTKCFSGELVGHNLNYDDDYLQEVGVVFPDSTTRHDTGIVDALCYELHDSFTLNAVAKRRGFPLKDEKVLQDAITAYGLGSIKGDLHRLPAKFVGAYGEYDAELPVLIRRHQIEEIAKKDLGRVHRLEQRVYLSILAMQRKGVAVSQDRLDRLEQWSIDQENNALREIKVRTGHHIGFGDCTKPAVFMPLVKSFGVQWGFTSPPKGASEEKRAAFKPKPQIDRSYLERVGGPTAKALQRARDMFKLRTTFIKGIRAHLTNGRIHCSFVQMRRDSDDLSGGASGTISGRAAATHTNMQNQPARHPEIGPLLRGVYVPDDGGMWCANDFSQQEPRGVVHYAEACGLSGAERAGHAYRTDPSTDNHSMMTKIINDIMGEGSIERKAAKVIFLAKCYGMGEGKLCVSLGLPTVQKEVEWGGVRRMVTKAGPEGLSIINAFDHAVPFVRALAKMVEAKAKRYGYITTLGGRRANFPRSLQGRGYEWTYKALNRLIQGSAAGQTKEAMAATHEAGFANQLQVHDELDLTVHSESEARRHAEIMQDCMPMRVPAKVDTELGESWGASMLSSDRVQWLVDFYEGM